MDGPLPRRCGTCRFHRPGLTPCSGRCQHPTLQPPDGHVRPLVRDRELHCYRGWGRDSWEPKPSANWERGGPDNGRRLSFEQPEPYVFALRETEWQGAARGRASSVTLDDERD